MTFKRAVFGALAAAVLSTGALAQDNDVVATVNGIDVTRDEVTAAINSLPAEYRQLPIEALWEPMLNQVIDRKLIADAAREEGLDESPAYQAEMATLADQVLQQYYLQGVVDAQVTEDGLKEAYQRFVEDYEASGQGDEVHARHILVESEEEAAAIFERIAAGESFEELAMSESIGPSGEMGGDLGWFRREDMVPEFGDAAFAMEPGEVSGPVESPFGWHVIKVEERRSTPTPTFEDMVNSLSSTLAEQAMYAEIARLRETAEIEIVADPPAAE